MACFHPLTAARWERPGKLPTRPVFGSAIEAGMSKMKLPCGQCIGCRLDHSSRWATRCMHESKSHEQNSFLTLTYSDEKMPPSLSVSKKPLQKFFKDLRNYLNYGIKSHLDEARQIPNPEFTVTKYFACGEYSPKKTRPVGPFNPWEFIGEGERPHYHAILFGYDFPDKELWTVRNGLNIYSSDILADIWGKGHCTIGSVTHESAGYVARYSLKKINGSLENKPCKITGLLPYERICHYTGEILQVEKERLQMSNGIGRDFYNCYTSDIYPADSVVINGHETRPPRYYDNLYDAEQPGIMEDIKNRRIKNMEKHRSDNTPARLAEREKVKMAQLKQLKRDQL